MSSLPLPNPWDIVVLSDIEAVVTRNKSLVMLCILGGRMSITSTTALCYGERVISKYGDKLVVTCICI